MFSPTPLKSRLPSSIFASLFPALPRTNNSAALKLRKTNSGLLCLSFFLPLQAFYQDGRVALVRQQDRNQQDKKIVRLRVYLSRPAWFKAGRACKPAGLQAPSAPAAFGIYALKDKSRKKSRF
jgi:hypothetical protein